MCRLVIYAQAAYSLGYTIAEFYINSDKLGIFLAVNFTPPSLSSHSPSQNYFLCSPIPELDTWHLTLDTFDHSPIIIFHFPP